MEAGTLFDFNSIGALIVYYKNSCLFAFFYNIDKGSDFLTGFYLYA
jgi:hypothetical protein